MRFGAFLGDSLGHPLGTVMRGEACFPSPIEGLVASKLQCPLAVPKGALDPAVALSADCDTSRFGGPKLARLLGRTLENFPSNRAQEQTSTSFPSCEGEKLAVPPSWLDAGLSGVPEASTESVCSAARTYTLPFVNRFWCCLRSNSLAIPHFSIENLHAVKG